MDVPTLKDKVFTDEVSMVSIEAASLFRIQRYLFLFCNVPFLELKVQYFALEEFPVLSKWLVSVKV